MIIIIAKAEDSGSTVSLKNKIDWSKWTTVEGEQEVITDTPTVSPGGANEDYLESNKPKLHLDWSRWTTPERTTTRKYEIVTWFKEVTNKVLPTKHVVLNLDPLPRKPKR